MIYNYILFLLSAVYIEVGTMANSSLFWAPRRAFTSVLVQYLCSLTTIFICVYSLFAFKTFAFMISWNCLYSMFYVSRFPDFHLVSEVWAYFQP